jgi:hypothetical protein
MMKLLKVLMMKIKKKTKKFLRLKFLNQLKFIILLIIKMNQQNKTKQNNTKKKKKKRIY